MHLGLILDGNRRWAKKRGLPAAMGHKRGIENFQKIVEHAAAAERIDTISAFALSTENLNRSAEELDNLFQLFAGIEEKTPRFIEHGITVRFLGNLELLPDYLVESFARVTESTSAGSRLCVNLCVAFGGRDEIVRAASRLAAQNLSIWNEDELSAHLDSSASPPLDLVIRTGGQKRISNFMIWEAAYAEFYFTDTLWPAFTAEELEQAIAFFDEQKRNFGK